jgi:DNA-3-methyladenine glycosylase
MLTAASSRSPVPIVNVKMTNGLLLRSFFERDPDAVARDLIGVDLVIHTEVHEVRARIVETEAYGASDDPASHAFRGSTPRCAVMFGPAGFLYVYRSYGIHWCMNVVTGQEGTASAVLLRAAAIVPSAGEAARADTHSPNLRGPGNLTRGLGITGADNGTDCCEEPTARVSFREVHGHVGTDRIGRSQRIGISRGQERLSRYFLEGHPAVSLNRSRST